MTQLSTYQSRQLMNWFRMSIFINKSNQKSNDFLQKYGLTIAQFDTLNQIFLHQPLTQQELATYLMVSKGGISQMIQRLEKNNWIYRIQNWKIKSIHLTEEGRQLVEGVQAIQAIQQASLLNSLTEAENKTLSVLLKKLNQGMKEEEK